MTSKIKQLIDAAEDGNTANVVRLVEEGVDVNGVNRFGLTPLHRACGRGHTDTVNVLLAHQADVNAIGTSRGDTPLHKACVFGHTDIVNVLLAHKADVNARGTSRGDTPLHKACVFGHTDIVNVLLAHKADVNARGTSYGQTPLHRASVFGHTDIVNVLLAHQADVNAIGTSTGDTPLHKACQCGHTDTVNALLAHQADVNARDGRDKHTPLHQACEKYDPSDEKRISTCVLLIEAGGDTNIVDKDGKTPFDLLQPKYGIETPNAKPLIKAIERRKYHVLLADRSVPISVVKLFLLGDPTVGKTTLKKSLINKDQGDPQYVPTPGIDVSTHDVKGVGRLSIWDTAGQIEYHVTHGMFLGYLNSVVAVVYNMKDKESYSKKRLQYWLRFLKCGQPAKDQATAKANLQIVIVATHLDDYRKNQRDKVNKTATRILEAITKDFQEFEIFNTVILMNACQSQSEEMKQLRRILKFATDAIKTPGNVPLIDLFRDTLYYRIWV